MRMFSVIVSVYTEDHMVDDNVKVYIWSSSTTSR